MENEKLFEFMTQMYSEMKEGFNRFDSNISGLDSKMKEGFNRFDSKMKEGFSRLDSELKDIKRTLLHIEQDHGKKLEVIFDGLTLHTDQLNRIEERLNKHDDIEE